jgi:hypothetical protein
MLNPLVVKTFIVNGMHIYDNKNFIKEQKLKIQWTEPEAILVSDWLISKKFPPLKPLGQMNRNLVGSIYGRFCIQFPQNRMKGERHRLSPLNL